MNRIDAYSHVLTEEAHEKLSELNPGHDKHPPSLAFLENVGKRVEYLDEFGVDKQVISLAEPRVWRGIDPEEGLQTARFTNDEVRRYADAYPDRFIPIANIPFPTVEYVDEVRRCINDLDMVGVQIYSNIDGRFLDDEDFFEFYQTVEELEVPIWIHPQYYNWHDADEEDHWLYTMLGWPFDTTVAIARLILNGVMDQFPDLEIVTHHLGGFIPYVSERMASWIHTREEYADKDHAGMYTGDIEAFSQPFESYFDRIYADTAVSSRGKEHTLRCGYDFFGPDNILFGADMPFGPEEGTYWMREVIPTLEDMDMTNSAKNKIFAENISQLIS